MTKTTPCPKCTRPIHKQSKSHKPFCDKIPPPNELQKYIRMSWSLMCQLWGISTTNRKTLQNHFEQLGIEVTEGEACRCGLRKTKQLRTHEQFCKQLFKQFDGRTAYEARQTLQELINKYPLQRLADMYGVHVSTLKHHLNHLCIVIPSNRKRNAFRSNQEHLDWLDSLTMPLENIQEALKYFNVEAVGREVGLSRWKAVRRFREMGFDLHKNKERFLREYQDKHGKKPDMKFVLYGVESVKYESCNCPRCDMMIYENADNLPPLALILDAKGGINRCQPSIINQWTQKAIALQRVKGDRRWRRVAIEYGKGKNTTIKKEWRFLDDKTQLYYKVGELLCRFCMAELNGETAPLPPIWTTVHSDLVETTTDGDGIYDDFEDDFSFEDEVMYA